MQSISPLRLILERFHVTFINKAVFTVSKILYNANDAMEFRSYLASGVHGVHDYIPQGYENMQSVSTISTSCETIYLSNTLSQLDAHQGAMGTTNAINPYDTYLASNVMAGANVGNGHSQINPYAQDNSGMGTIPTGFYQGGQNGYAQPVSRSSIWYRCAEGL
jgi:hypothetical protein